MKAELRNPDNWRSGLLTKWPLPNMKVSGSCKYRFRCMNYPEMCQRCKYAHANYFDPYKTKQDLELMQSKRRRYVSE